MAFISFLNSRSALSAETRQELRKLITIKYYQPRSFLRKKGELSDHIYYIRKGVINLYRKKEKTDWISFEDQVICPFNRFLNREPSSVFYEVLEHTEIHLLNYNAYLHLCKYEDFRNAVYHTIIERLYKVNKFLCENTGPAATRYNAFVSQFPGILNRIPLNIIASFLDVTPKTINRIRKCGKTDSCHSFESLRRVYIPEFNPHEFSIKPSL